jgi:inhibitor of KinA
MSIFPKISPLGDRGILIEFEKEISLNNLDKLLFFKNKLQEFYLKEKVEVINTYNSLLVSYMFTIEDVYDEISRLKELFQRGNISKKYDSRIFYLPVCYDPEFGLDLEYISREKELTEDEIIELHSTPVYHIYFIGFLPGFLYLGGLDDKLQISRKNTPRKSVEKGAVGIGEKQTGIYPKSSPGGWQILGKCPLELFDQNEDPPCQFSAGDKVKFYPISKEEFFELEEKVREGNYELKSEIYES